MGSIKNRTIVAINVEVAKDLFLRKLQIKLTRYFI